MKKDRISRDNHVKSVLCPLTGLNLDLVLKLAPKPAQCNQTFRVRIRRHVLSYLSISRIRGHVSRINRRPVRANTRQWQVAHAQISMRKLLSWSSVSYVCKNEINRAIINVIIRSETRAFWSLFKSWDLRRIVMCFITPWSIITTLYNPISRYDDSDSKNNRITYWLCDVSRS